MNSHDRLHCLSIHLSDNDVLLAKAIVDGLCYKITDEGKYALFVKGGGGGGGYLMTMAINKIDVNKKFHETSFEIK